MSYELSGTVKEIFDTQTFSSGFSKRAFVVTTEADKFPQDIQLECLKERIDMVDQLSKGDKVTVHFDINGREWNGKYFVNLAAWKIDKQGGGSKTDEEAPIPSDDSGEIGEEDEPPF